MEKLQQMEQLLAEAKVDAVKFYEGGNKSAGTRLRKSMMQIKNLSSDIRKNVSEVKNA